MDLSSHSLSSAPLTEEDYDTIAAAVMETARGRWFMKEYALRNRQSDTNTLLTALSRLEATITDTEKGSSKTHQIRADLIDLLGLISATKAEVASLRPYDESVERLENEDEAFDAVLRTAERATATIMEAAEAIQETAWRLREQEKDEGVCNALDRNTISISIACGFHDITVQRITKTVSLVRTIEARVLAIIADLNGEAFSPALTSTVSKLKVLPAPQPVEETLPEKVEDPIKEGFDDDLFDALYEERYVETFSQDDEREDADIKNDGAFRSLPLYTLQTLEAQEDNHKDEVLPPDSAMGFIKNANPLPGIDLLAFAKIDSLKTTDKLQLFT